MKPEIPPPAFRYDAFISYSRHDGDFACRFERTLRGYRPPAGVPVPQRNLRVFRDESDFQGVEYHASLERHLRDAAKLIVLCSPDSASSEYVGDEIRRFAEYRGRDHIVSVLVAGAPNNEAGREGEASNAFSPRLVQLLPVPLASDYRGFDLRRDHIRKGRFESAWYKLLADLYSDYGVDRAQIERRERIRVARRRRIIGGTSSAIGVTLVALTIWALLSRQEARRQRDLAVARQYTAEAALVFDDTVPGLLQGALLSAASLESSWTADGHKSLASMLALLPRPPIWKQAVPASGAGLGTRHRVLAFCPNGSRIAASSGGMVRLLDTATGRELRAFEEVRAADMTALAFSPDGAALAIGCGHQVCVVDVDTGAIRARLPPDGSRHGEFVWSTSFSPDGQLLAAASYHSSEANIYETASWQLVAHIGHGAPTVLTVAFGPDSKILATTDHERLRLWRVAARDAPAAEARVSNMPWGLAFSPDGGELVVAGQGVQRWRIVTEPDAPMRVEAESGFEAAKAPQIYTVMPADVGARACLVAGGPDGVHLLDRYTLAESLRLPVTSVAMAVSPNGAWLVNEDQEGELALWSLVGGTETRVDVGDALTAIATADEKQWLAAGTESGLVAIVDTSSWSERTRLRLSSPIRHLGVGGRGLWLVVTTDDAWHVFDARTWREAHVAKCDSPVSWAVFDSEFHWLVVLSDNRVSVIDTVDWRERVGIDHDGPVEAVRMNPDGTGLATRTAREFARGRGLTRPTRTRVWTLPEGREVASRYHEESSMYYLPRDETLHKSTAIVGDANVLRASESWPSLPGQQSLAIESGDKRWRATASFDVVTLNEGIEQRTVATLSHADEVRAICFIPKDAPRWLVSASDEGLLRAWPITPENMIAETCEKLRASLSSETWSRLAADPRYAAICAKSMKR